MKNLMTWTKFFVSFFLLTLASALSALPQQVQQLTDQKMSDDYQVYYFFAFHCHACKKWSSVFEPMLDELEKKNIKVMVSPLAMDKGQFLLAKAYHVAKLSGLNFSGQQFFEFYESSYFLTENKVMSFLNSLDKSKGDSKNYWIAQSTLIAESKIKKSGTIARDYGVNATPFFLILGPTGAFAVYPSEELHPKNIPEVINQLIFNKEN